MKIDELLKSKLESHGMFPRQAEAVVEAVKAAPENEAMAGRWNDEHTDYPAVIVALLWRGTIKHALEYIDRECPRAWCRPMFAD